MPLHWMQLIRASSPLIVGFIIGSLLSLAVFPKIHKDLTEQDCAGYTSENEEKFEAIINQPLPGSLQTTANRKPKLNRPRFFASELGLKDKLFVGVVSSRSTVASFAVAMNLTSSHHVSKMNFFTEGPVSESSFGGRPLNLVGISHMKEHLKPLYVLEYVAKTVLNNYDWFFILPDTSYLNGFKLFELATHMSVGGRVLLGHRLQEDPRLCDFQAGLLLSADVMRELKERLPICRRSFSDSSVSISVNLGRCILEATKLECAEEWNGRPFKTWRLSGDGQVEEQLRGASHKDLMNVLTAYPVSKASDVHRLHQHFCVLELEQLSQLTETIQSEIANSSLPSTWPAGIPKPWKPRTRYEMFRWDFFTAEDIFPNSVSYNSRKLTGSDRKDVDQVLRAAQRHIERKRKEWTFRRLLSGYRKFDPTRGLDYYLDVIVEEGGTELIRRLHLVRPLSRAEVVTMPYVTENTELFLLLPVRVSEVTSARRFLRRFVQTCAEAGDSSRLLIVFLQKPRSISDSLEEEFSGLAQELRQLRERFGSRPVVDSMKLMVGPEWGALSVVDAVLEHYGHEHLYLLMVPQAEFQMEFLNRVRMNTIRGVQSFFPIPFAQFNPKIASSDSVPQQNSAKTHSHSGLIQVHKNVGHFDSNDFQVASFYGSDYAENRVRNAHTIVSGSTGRDLANLFLGVPSMHLMRATEPALKIRFHERLCSSSLSDDDHDRCVASRRQGLASKAQLSALVLQQMDKIEL